MFYNRITPFVPDPPEVNPLEQQNASFAIPAIKRRRGAPIGNTNALKHGLYSPRHNAAAYTEQAQRSQQNLDEEIALLRYFIRRLVELSENVDTLYDAAGLLRVLSMASTSLTNMLKTQFLLFGGQAQAELSTALKDVLADMRAQETGHLPLEPE